MRNEKIEVDSFIDKVEQTVRRGDYIIYGQNHSSSNSLNFAKFDNLPEKYKNLLDSV